MPNREIRVAHVDDLQDGQMKKVTAGDRDVLLARIDGTYVATGAECPHQGASLEDGALHGDECVCPWHHARFELRNGGLVEPPSLDPLPRYKVRVSDGNVFVTVPEKESPARRCSCEGFHPGSFDNRTFVVLGTGAAGGAAVEALRRNGFDGRIVLVSRDEQLPYDRTWLSKDYLAEGKSDGWIPYRSKRFYDTASIQLELGRQVCHVDAVEHSIDFLAGPALRYDQLLVATGSEPIMLDVPGKDLKRIHTLRRLEDADAVIADAGAAGKAVVVGASFIGMEVAAALRKRDLEVTVVAPETVPFAAVFGEDVGGLVRKVHEEQGVQFRLEETVTAFEGSDAVENVKLESGDTLDADLVVVGIGVRPVTGMLSGIGKNEDGSVNVDKGMRVVDGDGSLYAAGDIAAYPDPGTGQRRRIEHWRFAQQMGRVAAKTMVGQAPETFDKVPFFWTSQFDLELQHLGGTGSWDEAILDGDLEEMEFLVYFVKDGAVVSVAGNWRDRDTGIIEECMRRRIMPDPDDLRGGGFDWEKLRHVE